MAFKDPVFFVLIPLAVAALVYASRRSRQAAFRFSSARIIPETRQSWKLFLLGRMVIVRGVDMKTICFVLLPFCLTLAVSYADGQREQTGQSDLVLTRLRVPRDYPTIQAAIGAAHDGDTVFVSEGTYYENIRYRGKAITIGSLYVIDGDTSHIARTIIDGSRSTQPDSGSVSLLHQR